MAGKKPKPPYARIAITLPPEVLAAADRTARRIDRSRSWVIAEAVRRFAETPPAAATGGRGSGRAERPPAPAGYAAASAVASARLHQVLAGLALPPVERLRRAAELLALAGQVRPRRPAVRIIGFPTLEDFAEWKQWDRIRAARRA